MRRNHPGTDLAPKSHPKGASETSRRLKNGALSMPRRAWQASGAPTASHEPFGADCERFSALFAAKKRFFQKMQNSPGRGEVQQKQWFFAYAALAHDTCVYTAAHLEKTQVLTSKMEVWGTPGGSKWIHRYISGPPRGAWRGSRGVPRGLWAVLEGWVNCCSIFAAKNR